MACPVVVIEELEIFYVVERATARVLAECRSMDHAAALAKALRGASRYELDTVSAAYSACYR